MPDPLRDVYNVHLFLKFQASVTIMTPRVTKVSNPSQSQSTVALTCLAILTVVTLFNIFSTLFSVSVINSIAPPAQREYSMCPLTASVLSSLADIWP